MMFLTYMPFIQHLRYELFLKSKSSMSYGYIATERISGKTFSYAQVIKNCIYVATTQRLTHYSYKLDSCTETQGNINHIVTK